MLFNVGPPPMTLVQHQTDIVSTICFCLLCKAFSLGIWVSGRRHLTANFGSAIITITKSWYTIMQIMYFLLHFVECVVCSAVRWPGIPIQFIPVWVVRAQQNKDWTNVVLMLGHRLRCWPNSKLTLGKYLVFARRWRVYIYGSVHYSSYVVIGALECLKRHGRIEHFISTQVVFHVKCLEPNLFAYICKIQFHRSLHYIT